MGSMIGIHQQSGTVSAYLALPQDGAYKGAVIVVHELWGLTDHIKKVVERLAHEGYYALAPDLNTTTETNRKLSEEVQKAMFDPNPRIRMSVQPKIRTLLAPTQTPQFMSLTISRLEACFEYVYNQPLVHQKVAVIGFSLGGSYVYNLAVREPRLRAAAVFYAHTNYLPTELRHIRCPVMAFYGQKDTSFMQAMSRLMPRMQQADVNFTPVTYENAGHGFLNETNPFTYNKTASEDAWNRIRSFLHLYMR